MPILEEMDSIALIESIPELPCILLIFLYDPLKRVPKTVVLRTKNGLS